jgi:hypothetical protein
MTDADSAEVSFFRPVPDGPGFETLDDAPASLTPTWSGPPVHEQPVPLGLFAELGRSDSTVVLIEGARVHADGVVLRLTVRVRETPRELRRRLFAELEFTSGRGMLGMNLRPGGLRWGFEFSDGKRVTSIDDGPWVTLPAGVRPSSWQPDSPVLTGLGNPTVCYSTWSRDLWLWPLPPPGPLRCLCLWPDRDIAETSTSLDTEPIRDAALGARETWINV